MAPRKSTSSTTAPGEANGDVSMVSNASTTHAHPASAAASHSKPSRQSGGHKQQDDGVSIDDLLLPRSLVTRLARGVLPANTSIQKDATLALAKSATVFISYLAHHANEQTNKKTISPQDVIKALEQIEMGGVMELGAVGQDGRLGGRLERELEAYEEHIRGKRKGYRDKVKARESAGGAAEEGNPAAAAQTDDAEVETAERGEPSNKKARRLSEDENEDDDERMLEAQLNGSNAVDEANGHGEGQEEEEEADEDDEQEEEEEDEEEEEEEENDGEEDQDEQDEEGETDADESEGRRDRGNNPDTRRVGLMPDGNVDMSGEESD
ncbi:hypothetical protein H2204_010422 [Knufia peltigerae]|uniref:DNA polymerase epsilon subunit D n=1 Tax=Knufia peltigerae TaxID=1002370 RepID=A0AA38XW76_9EURO|nr:hypothetical protein H2204_010422 [Knufia peltigerae]